MRRNLLAFLAGALIALAAVLIARSPDGGTDPAGAVSTSPGQAPSGVRAVRLPRAPARHHRRRAPAPASGTPDRATAASPAPSQSGTPASSGPPARGPSVPPTTTPAPPVDTVPTDGGGTTTTPADGAGSGSGAGTGTGTPNTPGTSTGPSGVTTIPNPATPDASVGQP
jgi:hypothetical protein